MPQLQNQRNQCLPNICCFCFWAALVEWLVLPSCTWTWRCTMMSGSDKRYRHSKHTLITGDRCAYNCNGMGNDAKKRNWFGSTLEVSELRKDGTPFRTRVPIVLEVALIALATAITSHSDSRRFPWVKGFWICLPPVGFTFIALLNHHEIHN